MWCYLCNPMSIQRLHCPFLGVPLNGISPIVVRNNSAFRTCFKSQYHDDNHVLSFSAKHSSSKINSIQERFSRSKALVKSVVVPLWKEGLLLFRCSVFVLVISAVGLLVWYGQRKAKYYVESRLLPSVCSFLSEYLQREIDIGTVRHVSPLSITLDSSSLGPHHDEFSCGEIPRMKIRVRPFASLKRGKIVIDAILSRPSLMVAQKKDFTWLGIPSSEVAMPRHSSTEEGIDYRTKTRRLARESMASCWESDRDNAAREAAEMGYMVCQEGSRSSMGEGCEDGDSKYTDLASSSSSSSFAFDEHMHLGDHHFIDTGADHKLKHAELEKSFSLSAPGSGFKLWSGMLSGPAMRGFRRKSAGKETLAADSSAKKRILERSAAAALTYFRGPSIQKFTDPSPLGTSSLSGSHGAQHETLGVNGNNLFDAISDELHIASDKQYAPSDMNGAKTFEQQTFNTPAGDASNKRETNLLNMNATNSQYGDTKQIEHLKVDRDRNGQLNCITSENESGLFNSYEEQLPSSVSVCETTPTDSSNVQNSDVNGAHVSNNNFDFRANSDSLQNQIMESLDDKSEEHNGPSSLDVASCRPLLVPMWPLTLKSGFPFFPRSARELLFDYLGGQIEKVKSCMNLRFDDLVAELSEGVNTQSEGIEKMLPVTLDSVYFSGGTLMLLGYGDRESREMDNVHGHVKFQHHYSRVHVQLSGNCKEWRSSATDEGGGWLSTDVVVDCIEQHWRANLKVSNLFAPLFERILDIPIMWSKGRASGEIHICMSRDDSFPNLHGQLDVKGLAFQIFDAPSSFSEMAGSLCFRGQRVFLHNASGWFGDVPLEASGDFEINPEDGEFHLMCQVPCVEVNALMKSFRMKPLLFPLAGSITAVFNCQGPLDAPLFVGSGVVSRKTANSAFEFPASDASEAMMRCKEAGAVAAFDRIPFSYVSANFTFNTDNNVADLYGIRATLLDGGEVRGAGNAWICPEGELDETAMDVNFSGNVAFDKVMHRYIPGETQLMPFRLGVLNGETKLSGSILRPRFDIKWAAPKAEGSFTDARGDIIISHESILVNSSAVAFDLYMKVQTSYPDKYLLNKENPNVEVSVPLIIEGVDMDLRMRGFEFFSLASSYSLDSPRPMHLKATGRVKFQGKVVKSPDTVDASVLDLDKDMAGVQKVDYEGKSSLVGEIAISGIKLNQLMLAPQLVGSLIISHENIKLDATGRPDESLAVEVVGPLQPTMDQNLQNRTLLSFSLQKGQLKANICYQPHHSVNVEVRNLPLDELELASLRGTIQKAELQLNFQKRRGHGLLSVLRPKFSGLLGEALDVSARWSGDVITVEKTVLEQTNSRYELQGEYVLPGTRDRQAAGKERSGLFEMAMAGHLGSAISSMGRWRMRLEVPGAEAAEMLPLARLLSRSTDPDVRSRSKEFFIRNLQSIGLCAENLADLLEVIRMHHTPLDEVILEDISLPGLAELKGHWHGSFDASGGGNGDTMD